MLVDLLNYGAAMQGYFHYNEEDLANSLMNEEMKAKGTQQISDCTNSHSKTSSAYYGTSFVFESNISVKMYVTGSYFDTDSYAEVTYTSHADGKTYTKKITEYTTSGSRMVFVFDGLVVADGRFPFTVNFYKADGTLVVSVVDGIESYVARGAATYPWLTTFMAFSDSAYAYLHA